MRLYALGRTTPCALGRRAALLALSQHYIDVVDTLDDLKMDLEVQVVAANKVIDRIKRTVQIVEGKPAVLYRRSIYFVCDGYIHVERVPITKFATSNALASGWKEVLDRFLPYTWPSQFVDCCESLRMGFSEHLPDGVIQAVSTLATMGYDITARELLLDFLTEKKDSESVLRDVRSAWIRDNNVSVYKDVNFQPAADESDVQSGDKRYGEMKFSAALDTDEPEMRAAAKKLQESIGTFVAKEQGASILGLGEIPDEDDWDFDLVDIQQTVTLNPIDAVLLDRVAKLGPAAVEILRYFADNPGDKAIHAENVLGYSKHDILKLLSGPLAHYVNKDTSGGWDCHGWVPAILDGFD